MAYTIVNPSRGNDYFDVAGVATTANTQPVVNGGAIAGILSSSTVQLGLKQVEPGDSIRLNETVLSGTSGAHDMMLTKANNSASLPYRTAGEYVIRGYSTTLGGVASTAIQFPGSQTVNRRSIDKVEAVRTRQVATAIRHGFWHETSGIFTTAPVSQNDISTLGDDHAALVDGYTLNGEFLYHLGAESGLLRDYPVKG